MLPVARLGCCVVPSLFRFFNLLCRANYDTYLKEVRAGTYRAKILCFRTGMLGRWPEVVLELDERIPPPISKTPHS